MLLLGALLAAFLLGTLRLATQSLWYDEGVTAMVAQMAPATLVRWTAADIQPPLYYLIVGGWGRAAGWNEWALRFPSVLAGVLAVALMARLAAELRRVSRPAASSDSEPRADSSPLWAAWLLALHPLAVYYTQEARMYALLLALCLGAAVALAPALTARMGLRRWLAYALCGLLALYTHYFAAFVLLAFALAWLWPVRAATATDRPRDLRAFLLAHAAIALGYAPWAVIMLRRLGDDASYWQGRLKLGEALAESAARFVAGETMAERTALLLAVVLLALTAVGVLLTWRRAPERRPALRFAMLWLAVPVAAVLALASFAPKFNVRYLFPALPALVLLWALPAATLLERVPAATSPADGRTRTLRWATAASLGALVAIFAWSNLNWFTQPRYAKAQWRQLTEFLRPRLQPEENVILVSGHAWPVWEYYAPDIPIVRLPDIDVLDVNNVLDFATTAGPLRAAVAERPGAWLVGWQDEVVDPNEVVPVQLELGGREKGSSARFSQLSLRRWSNVRDFRIADEPPITVPVDASFGDAVRLAGYHALDNGDLLLFWQMGPALAGRDLHVAMDTARQDGTPVAAIEGRRLAGYNDPTFRWAPDAVVMGRIPATDWLGPEPQAGPYTVTLRVFDGADAAAQPLPVLGADSLRLEDVTAVLE
jgi:4-amino-4-deoxy-L-arabinose transferase-like glycosyltransferase